MVVEIIIISLLIILAILFFIFRFSLVELADESKFGTYGPPLESQCISYDGKCSSLGFGTVTQVCTRNPETKRGCLHDLKQEFKPLKTQKKCQVACKSSIWSLESTSSCISNDICLNGSSYRTQTKKCVPNDASGPNLCTLEGSNPPDGCYLNQNIIECQVGTSLIERFECTPNLPKCGQLTNNGSLCDSEGLEFTPFCRSFENGQLIQGDSNLFKHGYYSLELTCNSVCKPPECQNNPMLIGLSLNNNKTSISCFNEKYYCNKPCMFLDKLQGNWNLHIKNLVGNFTVITKSQSTLKYFLTLVETPCSSINLSSTRTKLDCFGDPLGLLNVTPCTFMLANSTEYCTIPEVILMTGLLVTIKPTRNYNGNPNLMYCYVIAIWGDNYQGVLIIENNQLKWKQINLNKKLEFNPTEFTLIYNGLFELKYNGESVLNGINFEYNEAYTDSGGLNIVKFNQILNQRGTRLNPHSCNIMYSYPPPLDYSGI